MSDATAVDTATRKGGGVNLQDLVGQRMRELGMIRRPSAAQEAGRQPARPVLSYTQLAHACGLPTSTVTRLFREPGKERPRDATLEALAKGLQLPVSMLKEAASESIGFVRPVDPSETDITYVVEMMRTASGPVRVEIREVVDTILRAARRREEGTQDDQVADG